MVCIWFTSYIMPGMRLMIIVNILVTIQA